MLHALECRVPQVERYLSSVRYPDIAARGAPTPYARGGYGFRDALGNNVFSAERLRVLEGTQTQACVQFETGEFLFDEDMRNKVCTLFMRRYHDTIFASAP